MLHYDSVETTLRCCAKWVKKLDEMSTEELSVLLWGFSRKWLTGYYRIGVLLFLARIRKLIVFIKEWNENGRVKSTCERGCIAMATELLILWCKYKTTNSN